MSWSSLPYTGAPSPGWKPIQQPPQSQLQLKNQISGSDQENPAPFLNATMIRTEKRDYDQLHPRSQLFSVDFQRAHLNKGSPNFSAQEWSFVRYRR